MRFTLAALVAVPLALRSGRWRGAPLGRLAAVGVLLQVVQFGGVYGGFALGVPAALSALAMLGLSPLVTTGLAVGSGQERGDARLWAGLAIGVVGVAISLAPELGSARVGVGVAVTLVGMLGLASATVLQRRWGAVADPRVSVAAQSVTAALIVDPAALVFGGHVDMSARLVLCTAWLAWGMGIVSLLAMVSILRRHAASALAALLLAVPAVTAIGSALALGEALHPASLVGMLVATAGIGAVLRREAEPATAAAVRARRPRVARRSRTRAERRAGRLGSAPVAPEIERTASRPDAPILLVTKLQPPFVPPQAIVRERLLETPGRGPRAPVEPRRVSRRLREVDAARGVARERGGSARPWRG